MTWNYLTQDASIRHAGPMAQDFHAAFGLGESDLLINTVDIDGVNMAAVKALEARTAAQAASIRTLEAEVAALRAENASLAERLGRIEKMLRTQEQP
jgi:trimeric autotransporter adhesin